MATFYGTVLVSQWGSSIFSTVASRLRNDTITSESVLIWVIAAYA